MSSLTRNVYVNNSINMFDYKRKWIKYLNDIIETKSFTQKQLADYIGVNESQVTRWLKGISSPKPETIEKAIKKTGLALDFKDNLLYKNNAGTSTDVHVAEVNRELDYRISQLESKISSIGNITEYVNETITCINELTDLPKLIYDDAPSMMDFIKNKHNLTEDLIEKLARKQKLEDALNAIIIRMIRYQKAILHEIANKN